MPYASPVHVHALDVGQATYTASSKPSESEIGVFLEGTAMEIDAIMRAKGYEIPVATTATSTLGLLRQGNALGAAAFAAQGAQNSPKRDSAWKMWENFKRLLWEGELELDSAHDAGQSAPAFSFASESTATPVFYRGMDL